jgi:SCP-2 sterol transfer family
VKPVIELAPGAENNGFATMLSDLVRQNLEAKPHKTRDFDALSGTIAIVAEDAEVALTLEFSKGKLLVHDGIFKVPDVTIRGPSDAIMAMSNIPLTKPFGLPFWRRNDRHAQETMKEIGAAMRSGAFKAHGMAMHIPMMVRLTRVMSVNG